MGVDKFLIDKDEAMLLVVDIQERLAAVMDHREQVVSNTLRLIEAAKLLGIPVAVTEQYPKGLGPTVKEVRDVVPDYAPFEKLSFDCCSEKGFLASGSLLGRDKVIIAGMEAHICVLQTALGLMSEGYTVHMASDAVCSRTKANFRTAISMARDAGAVVTSTEVVLFQLLRKAGTEDFKAVSKLVR